MAELVPANELMQYSSDATADERAAVKLLIEKAQGVCPGVRVRFLQRMHDVVGSILKVGLEVPDLEDTQNYALHDLAHELEEQSGITLLVTQDEKQEEEGQLLKVKEFLSADRLSSEVIEPTEFRNVLWGPDHKRYKGVLIATAIGASMLAVWLSSFEWLGHTFPTLFGNSVPAKFEHRIDGVRGVRLNIDESIRQIDGQIEKRDALELTEKQVEDLRSEKSLLEKARKDLDQPH
ncbi:MAG: hypothetical protein JST89_20575 [Cyanobacteria bacterium SZAS-4]|nr:hypothetical protein [Cyanobacteria bacterium SZAS-4]